MAFLDNPTIILAHIRQSHVTSDDTGMCEMVLIDHDVDLEKTHPPSVPGDSGSEVQGSSGETQGYIYAQSVDITSSWDFGIRRRSNTAQRLERLRKERQNQIKCKNIQWKERNSKQSAQELKSLFEKKSLKEKPPRSGKQSILSVRLEQCPLQLNNPFNEYSKFDGKGHVGTTATKKIDVYLPLHSSQDRLLPMTVVTMASARVQDLIGLICWQYTSEGREPKLNDNVSAYCLHIAEDDGEVDTDFPPLDSNEPIHKFGFSTLALVEKYSSPGLTSKESLFVRINAAHGFSLIQVDNTKVTMKEILLKAVRRRKGSQKISETRVSLLDLLIWLITPCNFMERSRRSPVEIKRSYPTMLEHTLNENPVALCAFSEETKGNSLTRDWRLGAQVLGEGVIREHRQGPMKSTVNYRGTSVVIARTQSRKREQRESLESTSDRGPQYRLEKQSEPNIAVDLESTLESQNAWEFCLVRENSSRADGVFEEDSQIDIATVQDMLSSHHYKSFKVSMIHRLRFTTDVQLGISGDKVEIDPVTNQKASTKFWIKQKPISIDCDLLCACDLAEEKSPSISGDKVEIDPVTNQKASTKFWIKQKPISIDCDLLCACDLAEEKSPSHAVFKLTYLSSHDYKHLYFESDAATVSEIVLKVNYILESRASTARADYFAQKQRKLNRRTSFSFQKEKKSGQQ
ncbi:Target of rapamycin complex 2 subunit MAPKAP1 [Apodemus speciosus]|uniref:Target of rapamycin complex 2 subunit MAPKAP1 n=1 Tax=Apodemus speciosus TaxID=105296 RepID=A0ABQ0EHA0_APOSI